MPRRPKRKYSQDVHGVILLDKPQGMTSNHALQRVKHLLKANRAGHTGSLDPLATGCLPLCLGEATKISSYLLEADKHYETVARLGRTTDTDDAEGQTVLERAISVPSLEELEKILDQFRGPIEQIPPMYSALHHNGQRLHKLARKGITVEREPRKVTVSKLKITGIQADAISLSVSCTKGTYIRSLVRDIGEILGCGAHVEVLRRTGVDPFTDPDMLTLEQLEERVAKGGKDDLLLPVDRALLSWEKVVLDAEQTARLKNGLHIALVEYPKTEKLVRVYDQADVFVGLGQLYGNVLKPKRLMSTAS